MEIPAVFVSSEDGRLYSLDARFSGRRIAVSGERIPFEDAVSCLPFRESRMPVAVVDLDSLSHRMFTEGVMKGMRIRGSDIWFLTWIETADDVFDAFNTTADTVIGMYHSSRSDSDLKDIHELSDCFVPAVCCSDGKALSRKKRSEDVTDVLSRLTDMGFYRICVMDTDCSIGKGTWETIADVCPSAVPFVTCDAPDGFRDFIRPVRPTRSRGPI